MDDYIAERLTKSSVKVRDAGLSGSRCIPQSLDTSSPRDQKASGGNTDGSDPLKQTEPAALIVGKRRGRPQTITPPRDMKAYRAAKAVEYRARKKGQGK